MANEVIVYVPRTLVVDLREFGFGIREVTVLRGGSSGEIIPGVPIPHDTVDSDSIVNDTIQMEDLNQSVKDTMVTGDDRVTQEELNNFDV